MGDDMAIIEITTTADSGAGSLRAAIAQAVDGDVITTASSAFPRGAEYVVTLSETLVIDKVITLAPGVKIILDGGGACRCLSVTAAATICDITARNGSAASAGGAANVTAASTFTRCAFLDSVVAAGNHNGVYCTAAATFNACLFRTAARYALSAATPADVTCRRCTIIGGGSQSGLGLVDSIQILNSAASTFCIDAAAGNYHLSPESAYTSGAYDTTVATDLDGNPTRGDGSGSLGCYENYETQGAARIFWIGGAAGAANDPANWAASRYGAALSELPTIANDGRVYVLDGGAVTMTTAPAQAGAPAIVGGFTHVTAATQPTTDGGVILNDYSALTIAAGVTVAPTTTSTGDAAPRINAAGEAVLNPACGVSLADVTFATGGSAVVYDSINAAELVVPAGVTITLAPAQAQTATITTATVAGALRLEGSNCAVGAVQLSAGAALAFDGAQSITVASVTIAGAASLVNTINDYGAAFVTLSALTIAEGAAVAVNNTGLISVPEGVDLSAFSDASKIVRRGANISALSAQIVVSTLTATITRAAAGDVLIQARDWQSAGGWQTLGKDGATLATVAADTRQTVRAFDGVHFLTADATRRYWYIGGDAGSFAVATDWSLASGGAGLTSAPTVAGCDFIIE